MNKRWAAHSWRPARRHVKPQAAAIQQWLHCPLVVLTFTHLPLDTVNPLLHWVQPLAPHWRHPAGHCGGQVGG